MGFTWRNEGEEDLPDKLATIYTVKAIYKPHGVDQTYVIVECSGDEEEQLDHRLEEVRELIFFERIGSKHQQLPYFLQWEQVRGTMFAVPYHLMQSNAICYADTSRYERDEERMGQGKRPSSLMQAH